MNQIKLALPKGSLNDPDRGFTQKYFINAGYDIRGYSPSKESNKRVRIVNDPEIAVLISRPEDVPLELSNGVVDIAITGEDWIKERTISGMATGIRKIGDLEYGDGRIVIAAPADATYKSLDDFFSNLKGRDLQQNPVRIYTEYVSLTQGFVSDNKGYQRIFGNEEPLVEAGGGVRGKNNLVKIIESHGATETAIDKGMDLIVDITQTGNSLIENKLKILEEIMRTSAGLYAGPTCAGWKQEKAEELYALLHGAVVADRYLDVKFNIPISELETVRGYLRKEQLYSDEPTITVGERFAQVNILIPKERFPKVLSQLRQTYSASAIVADKIQLFVR